MPRRRLSLLALLVSPLVLAAPPSSNDDAVEIVLDKDGMRLGGQAVATADALIALLQERQVRRVRLLTDSSAVDYQLIGKIIYGTQRAGIELVAIDNRAAR
jgi:biopolymer transport protein ExbD